MKAFITAVVLVASFSAMAAIPDKNCYPFAPNKDGFNRACISIEKPQSLYSRAEIEIYRFEKLVKLLPGQRLNNEREILCDDPRFFKCFSSYPGGLRVFSDIRNTEAVELEITMLTNRPSTCFNGKVFIKEQNRVIQLNVVCPTISRKREQF